MLRRSVGIIVCAGLGLPACGSGSCEEPVERKYEQYCAACHTTGAAGAPRRGDAASWEPRLAKGEAALVDAVRDGIPGMPPKGLCHECTDEDYKALIECMSP